MINTWNTICIHPMAYLLSPIITTILLIGLIAQIIEIKEE